MREYANAPILPKSIESLADAIQFIVYLYLVDRLNFHPDNRFETYYDGGRAFYTPEEARLRERLRREAWEIADLYSLSIWVAAWFGYYPTSDLEDAPPEVLTILKKGFGTKQDWSPRNKRRSGR